MGRHFKKVTFKINNNKARVGNKCHIIEGGVECDRDHHCRGLCNRHHTYFLRHGLVERYGLKNKMTYFDKTGYRIQQNPVPGKCHIMENGQRCNGKRHGRGLCTRHWLTFTRHNVIDLYGTTSRKSSKKCKIKRQEEPNVCRIIEDGHECSKVVRTRGLCSKHYLRFNRSGELSKFGKKRKLKYEADRINS